MNGARLHTPVKIGTAMTHTPRYESAARNFDVADRHVVEAAIELAKALDHSKATNFDDLKADVAPRLINYRRSVALRANYLDDMLTARVAEFADRDTVDAVEKARAAL